MEKRNKYILFNNVFIFRVFNELETNFNAIIELLLLQTDCNEYLSSLKNIIKAIENSVNLKTKNVYQVWSLLQTKLNEFLKQLNKTSSEIQQKTKFTNYEPIYMLLTFPLKHFLNFKLEQVSNNHNNTKRKTLFYI